MLVRILEYNYDDEKSKLENGKFLAGYKIKDYDIFLHMLQNMIGKDIVIANSEGEEEWYTFEGDYLLNFPRSEESEKIMCLDVFVCGY